MAAPTFLVATTGQTDAGGTWIASGTLTGAAQDDLVIFHILQDGSSAGAISLTTVTANLMNLAGTTSALTSIGSFQVGGTSLAIQHLWVGRLSSSSVAVQIDGANSSTEDLYYRFYSFQNASAGTTLATVIENATAGSTTTSTGTSATVSDASVQTLGSDRLALNFVGINDDNPFAGYSGQSGGTWTTRASYADATGTDGAIYLVDAAMATAGTIDGGTSSITDIDAWGVVGFALIGTTVDVARVPFTPSYPQLLPQ